MNVRRSKLSSSSPHTLDGLTALRCYAIIWIILHHWHPYAPAQTDFLFLQMSKYAFIALDLFFILSGFIISYVYATKFNHAGETLRNTPRFLLYRLGRIYPLHLLTLGVCFIGAYDDWFYVHSPTEDSFIAHLFLIQGWSVHTSSTWNYPSWSVSVEWLLYLLYPIFAFIILKSKTIRSNLCLYSLLSLMLCLDVYDKTLFTVHDFHYHGWLGGEITRAMWEFLLGIVMFNLRNVQILPQQHTPPITLLLTMISLSFVVLDLPEFLILPFLPWYILALSQLQGRLLSIIANKPARILGDASYSLYLWHNIVANIMWTLMTPAYQHYTQTASQLPLFTFYGACFAILIPLSIASNYLIEKPCRNLTKKLVYKTQQTA